jgi:hypothetical protein
MTEEIVTFFLVGALAQVVDGALGMAFGVISSSLLLSFGLPPATVSATVHVCKIATGAASGLSHLLMGNVNRRLFLRLVLPGATGAVIGAYVLTTLPVEIARPLVAAYLFVIALLILRRALRPLSVATEARPRAVGPLGFIGGILDATGGGGWGPIVTSGLLAKGVQPNIAIGSANLAEFLVAISASAVFVAFAELYWQAIVGLALGGVIMAPLAAYLCKRVPARLVLIAVGLLIAALSVKITVTTIALIDEQMTAAQETGAVVSQLPGSHPPPSSAN